MTNIGPIATGINAKLALQAGMLSGAAIPQQYPFPLAGAASARQDDVFLGAAPIDVLALTPAGRAALAPLGLKSVSAFVETPFLATKLAGALVDQALVLDLVEAQRQLRAIAVAVPN